MEGVMCLFRQAIFYSNFRDNIEKEAKVLSMWRSLNGTVPFLDRSLKYYLPMMEEIMISPLFQGEICKGEMIEVQLGIWTDWFNVRVLWGPGPNEVTVLIWDVVLFCRERISGLKLWIWLSTLLCLIELRPFTFQLEEFIITPLARVSLFTLLSATWEVCENTAYSIQSIAKLNCWTWREN